MKIFSTKWQRRKYHRTESNKLHPVGQLLKPWHFVRKLSVENIEQIEQIEIETQRNGAVFVPFGWRNEEWESFKSQVDVSRLWSFRLREVESEWRISYWEGYAERRWLGCTAVFAVSCFTELINQNINSAEGTRISLF